MDKDVKTQKGNGMNNISNIPTNFKDFVWMVLGMPYDPTIKWETIAQFCSRCATGLFDDDLVKDIDGLTVIYATRMAGAAYELYHYKEKVGVYSNSDIYKLECEVKNIIEEGAKRGLLNDIGLPESTVCKFIHLDELTTELIWPRKYVLELI